MIKLILKYIKSYRLIFILGSAAKLTEAILELYLPLLMANIIDIGIIEKNTDYIIKTGIQLIIIAFIGLLLALFCQYSAAVSSQGTGTKIRNALFEKISEFSYAELDKFDSSTLVNRITSDVNYVQQAIAYTARLVTRAPFLCVGAVIMSFRIDVKLTLIFLIIIPILIVILLLFMKITSFLYTKTQKKLDNVSLIIKENLSGVRVIRAFSKEKQEEKRFHKAVFALNDANIHVSNLAALINPITSIVINFGIIAILYFGAIQVDNGYLTQGNILALSTYATKIMYALIIVANLVIMFTKAMASSERINNVLNTEISMKFPQTTEKNINHENKIIEFNNVSFSYNHDKNIINNINFSVEKGNSLGIIGVTGSGKSTIINLLQRFYDVTDGEIKINGINIKNYTQNDLRENFGVVPQNNVLFYGNIAENIKWGNEFATDDEIIKSLKISEAYDFVYELPDKIGTIIQENGKNFSGGQRQRLAIARAIVKNPPILIMDDCLSAIDYKTDLMLRTNLKNNLSETTTIIVSQRISSVMKTDNIIVLSDGSITGIGKHEFLLKNCEIYQDIYYSQIQNDIENNSGGKKE